MTILVDQVIPVDEKNQWVYQASSTKVQFDGYSCGFLVCLKIWCHVDDPKP